MLNKENTNKIKNLIESKKYKTALEIIEEYFQSPLLNGDDEKILLDLKYEINEIVQNEIDQKTKKTTVELLNLLEKNELESFFKFYEKTLDELDEEKKYEFYNKIFTNNKISNFVKLELLDDFYKQKNIDLNRINISNSLTFKKFNCSTFSNFLKFWKEQEVLIDKEFIKNGYLRNIKDDLKKLKEYYLIDFNNDEILNSILLLKNYYISITNNETPSNEAIKEYMKIISPNLFNKN